jgi:Holliday junction resolvase|tara:strand:+ start:1872 stop:2249 length:378 start_codon:yes stop_codon:yes gene_type:complete
MAKNRESKLWLRLKKVFKDGQIFRVESNTINGIPDVYGIKNGKSFWCELKSNDRKNYNLSKFQINWHLDHNAAGGHAFILVKTLLQRGLKLLEIRDSRTLTLLAEGEDTEATLRLLVSRMLRSGL